MRPYMPFMAALVLFGAVACGASSSSSPSNSGSSKSPKPTAAQQAAAVNKAACLKITSASFATKAQATAFVSLLEGQASEAGVDNTLAGDMMTLSAVVSGHEAGTKGFSTAKLNTAQATVKTDCQKWAS